MFYCIGIREDLHDAWVWVDTRFNSLDGKGYYQGVEISKRPYIYRESVLR